MNLEMLIYLDSAQLAWIERLDSAGRAGFFDSWRRLGGELAVSMTHFQEVIQLSNPLSARRRLQVLLPFPSIRGLPASAGGVRMMEAELYLKASLGVAVDFQAEARNHLFPYLAHDEVEPVAFRFARDFRQFTAMEGLTAEGVRRVQRMQALPTSPIATFDLEKARKNISLMAAQIVARRPGLKAHVESIAAEVLRNLELSGGDPRLARERHYGLANVRMRADIPGEDLAAVSGFFTAARAVAPRVAEDLGMPLEEVHERVNGLNPYEAPGFRLQLAVLRARVRHPKPADASDIDRARGCRGPAQGQSPQHVPSRVCRGDLGSLTNISALTPNGGRVGYGRDLIRFTRERRPRTAPALEDVA